MTQETWDLFKSELTKQEFSLRRLNDDTRQLKYSDDVFKLDVIKKWMEQEHPDMKLEDIDHETMLWLVDLYIEDNVPTQFVNEEGDGDWYDETYDLWYDAFEYATIWDKIIDWEVRDELGLI
jgi:hypothetical protein